MSRTITDTFQKTLLHELNVCQHLATKLERSNADWRPRENMRSTLELMRYIATITSATLPHYITMPAKEGARDRYIAVRAETAAMPFDGFTERLESEKAQILRYMPTITDADLGRATHHPYNGADVSLIEALLSVQRNLTAYRHELFLHAKLCGASVNTMNNWGGVDPKPAA